MKKEKTQVVTKTSWKKAFKRDWQLYLMLLFPLAMVIIFSYAAYPGLRMVFMDYKPAKGYAGSDWVGMKTFVKIFKDADWKVRYDMPDSFKERFKKYILKGEENKDNGYLYDFQAIVEGCYSIRKINNFDVDINKLAVNMLNDLNIHNNKTSIITQK